MVLTCERKRKLDVLVLAKESWSDIDWALLGNETAVNAIDAWVRESNMGNRIAYNTWRLRNEQAVTAFILRWNGVFVA